MIKQEAHGPHRLHRKNTFAYDSLFEIGSVVLEMILKLNSSLYFLKFIGRVPLFKQT